MPKERLLACLSCKLKQCFYYIKNKCKAKYFNKNVSKVTADMAVFFLHKSKRASLVTFKDTWEEQKFVFFQLEKRGN